jgi:hypothetical protein
MTTVLKTKNFEVYTFGGSTYFVSYKGDNTALFAGTLRRATNYVNRAESYYL